MIASNVVFENHKSQHLNTNFHLLVGSLPGNTDVVVGVDPGVNFGMTIIHKDSVLVHWGVLGHEKRTGYRGVLAYDFIWSHLENFEGRGIVEGAAYHSKFGQVGLEEVRFGFFLAMHHLGIKTVIVPPATIRKVALGDGKMQAGDVWPFMNHNGADSLAIALYLLEKETENV